MFWDCSSHIPVNSFTALNYRDRQKGGAVCKATARQSQEETSRRAIDRYYQHRSYISNKNMETPAGSHFNSRGHSIGDLEMLPIEKVRPANNPHVRKCREKMWINLYQAVQHGENRQKSS